MLDAVTRSKRLQFVLEQLASYGGPKKEISGSTFVLCPYHSEKTPSGRIFHSDQTSSPGYFRCYGCGAKVPWDKLAPSLGLKPYKSGPPQEEWTAKYSFPPPESAEVSGFIKEQQRAIKRIPPNKRWRGISTNLLIKIGAHTSEFYAEPTSDREGYWTGRRLYLPVLINGILKGYIKARLRKHAEYPSYINASGSWSRTHGLFPFDYSLALARKISRATGQPLTIVLVEGQRDVLRLLELRIPALCILGTQSWSPTKWRLLELAGVRRVILMMDGDCAGKEAALKMRPTLQELFTVVTVKLWSAKGSPWLAFADEEEPSKAAKATGAELWDPFNCPLRILKKLRQRYFS